jgi:hypothetical protein
MRGTLLVTAIWLSFAAAAAANVAPPRKSRTADRDLPRVAASKLKAVVRENALPPESEPEFAVTTQTEVYLDGQPCSYRDVPARAGILRMEVAPDRKTVLKVFFRSPR